MNIKSVIALSFLMSTSAMATKDWCLLGNAVPAPFHARLSHESGLVAGRIYGLASATHPSEVVLARLVDSKDDRALGLQVAVGGPTVLADRGRLRWIDFAHDAMGRGPALSSLSREQLGPILFHNMFVRYRDNEGSYRAGLLSFHTSAQTSPFMGDGRVLIRVSKQESVQIPSDRVFFATMPSGAPALAEVAIAAWVTSSPSGPIYCLNASSQSRKVSSWVWLVAYGTTVDHHGPGSATIFFAPRPGFAPTRVRFHAQHAEDPTHGAWLDLEVVPAPPELSLALPVPPLEGPSGPGQKAPPPSSSRPSQAPLSLPQPPPAVPKALRDHEAVTLTPAPHKSTLILRFWRDFYAKDPTSTTLVDFWKGHPPESTAALTEVLRELLQSRHLCSAGFSSLEARGAEWDTLVASGHPRVDSQAADDFQSTIEELASHLDETMTIRGSMTLAIAQSHALRHLAESRKEMIGLETGRLPLAKNLARRHEMFMEIRGMVRALAAEWDLAALQEPWTQDRKEWVKTLSGPEDHSPLPEPIEFALKGAMEPDGFWPMVLEPLRSPEDREEKQATLEGVDLRELDHFEARAWLEAYAGKSETKGLPAEREVAADGLATEAFVRDAAAALRARIRVDLEINAASRAEDDLLDQNVPAFPNP
ncbi:MAG: hypothetical protein P4L36_07905 [Holophaga sp.]|nr:hypothetical protein [Holophaga sp.]